MSKENQTVKQMINFINTILSLFTNQLTLFILNRLTVHFKDLFKY